MNKIKCTHDVIIDDDKVIKSSSIDNPNYSGFKREKKIVEFLGVGTIKGDSIIMPNYGESGLFEISHIPILEEEISILKSKLNGKEKELNIKPIYDEEVIDKVKKRCNGDDVEKFFFNQVENIDIQSDNIVFGDLKPQNYCVKNNKITLIDYESVCLAPDSYDWSTLLMVLWEMNNMKNHAYSLIESNKWSEDTLKFKCAMSVTYHNWRYGKEAAYYKIEEYSNLMKMCGFDWN